MKLTDFLTGILIGGVLGLLNGWLLALTARKALTLGKAGGWKFVTFTFFLRFAGMVLVYFVIFKFLGKDIFLGSAAGLVIITIFSPFKYFLKNLGQKPDKDK